MNTTSKSPLPLAFTVDSLVAAGGLLSQGNGQGNGQRLRLAHQE